MSVPNFKNKYNNKALFSPEELVDCQKKAGKFFKGKAPKGIIFCYEQELMEYILKEHKVKKVANPYGNLYLLPETGNNVGVIGNFGFGAPVVSLIFEEFIAVRVKKFISIGTAGTMQKGLSYGDVVVCEKAVRDEGTSYHYLKNSMYAYASKVMVKKIKKSLEKFNKKYEVGSSWTVDAMFRETQDEIKFYRKKGVTTIDMEASALFAIAKYRKVDIGAIFTISDSLVEKNWKPNFHGKDIYKGLEILYNVALDVLV